MTVKKVHTQSEKGLVAQPHLQGGQVGVTDLQPSGYVGSAYLLAFMGSMFGTSHGAWAPATFTAKLGPPLRPYSATATIPNTNAYWTTANTVTTDIFGDPPVTSPLGMTNVQPITFSALSSADVARWDNASLAVSLQDATGVTVIVAYDYSASSGFLVTPIVGLQLVIGPQELLFALASD